MWSGGGLRALVDGRSVKDRRQGFEAIDPTFRRIALEKFDEYDGSRSRPNLQEIERQIRVALKNEGVEDPNLPDGLVQEFLSSTGAPRAPRSAPSGQVPTQGWGRKPTAKDRARYRKFESSLTDQQQFELAYALHKRA